MRTLKEDTKSLLPKYHVEVVPVEIEGESEEAYGVILTIDNQKFPFGMKYWKDKALANWYALNFERALRQTIPPLPAIRDARDAKLYRYLQAAPVYFIKTLSDTHPDEWEDLINYEIRRNSSEQPSEQPAPPVLPVP